MRGTLQLKNDVHLKISGVELENCPVGPLENTRKLGVETAMHSKGVD